MKENRYLRDLESKIKCLPVTYVKEIVSDYKSHFYEGELMGKKDNEIAYELGDVDLIANSIIAEYYIENTNKVDDLKTFTRAVTSSLNAGFGMLNILTILFYIVCLIIIIPTLYFAGIVILLAPPVFLIVHLVYPDLPISFGTNILFLNIIITFMLSFMGYKSIRFLNKYSPKILRGSFGQIAKSIK